MQPKDPECLLPNSVTGLYLEPARTERHQQTTGSGFLDSSELAIAVKTGDRRRTLYRRCPPDNKFRILDVQLAGLSGTWLIEDESDQSRRVPEPHQPSLRSSSNAASE